MVLIKKYLASTLLWILPVTFLTIGLSFDRAKYSNDPEYIYLINALSISKLRPVGHIDNPGTTVMELGAVIVNVAHFISPSDGKDLMTDVLENPDRYVGIFNDVLIFIISCTLLWLGYIVTKKSENLWAAIILQMTPFLSINLLEHAWTKVSPEPLLIVTSLLLSGLLIIYYFDENRNLRRYFLLFALISGFGLATKATFLPVAIIPFLLLSGAFRKAGYLFFVVLIFVIFTLPAWPEYQNMYTWYYNLATHTGIYGSGEAGMIDAGKYLDSVGKIFRNNIHFSVLLLLSVSLLIGILASSKFRTTSKSLQFRILQALTITDFVAILIVAKHYHANHYLLPVLALSGLTIFFILENLRNIIPGSTIQKVIMPVIIGFFVVYLPVNNIPTLAYYQRGYKTTNDEYENIMKLIEEKYNGYQSVYYYPTSLNKESALMFGNMYSKKKNLEEIKTVYPETIFYDHTLKLFKNWGAELSLEDVINTSGNKILLVGGPISDEWKDVNQKILEIISSGFPLKTVYQGRTQAMYILDTVAYEILQNQRKMNGLELSLDMEQAGDIKEYIAAGTNLFLVYKTRTSEKARSGNFSIKLDKNQQYSLGYTFENTRPGDNFKISIWRYSSNNEGFLSVTSTPDAFYYRQNNEPIETDEKGWKKIQLLFTAPENLNNNQLKFYVWNNGSSEMFFDDLTIEKK
jgi:hypothetical protein